VLARRPRVISGQDYLNTFVPSHVVHPDTRKKTDEFLRHHTPVSDLLHSRLRPTLAPLVPTEDDWDGLFDDFEYLLGTAICHHLETSWGPIGRFGWRRRYESRGARDAILTDAAEELLDAGMFNGSKADLDATHQRSNVFLATVRLF
jgi:hypothetical protein